MSVPGLILRKLLGLLRCISACVKGVFRWRRTSSSSNNNIGELPYTMPADRRTQFDGGGGDDVSAKDSSLASSNNNSHIINNNHNSVNTNNTSAVGSWNSWTDETFGIESKIAEYRQLKQQSAAGGSGGGGDGCDGGGAAEPDFFNEMRPQLLPTKKLKLRDSGRQNSQQSSRNLFEVRENDVNLPETALSPGLGDLDFNAVNFNTSTAARFSQGGSDAADNWEDSTLPDDAHLDALAREQRRRERDAKHRQRVAEHERRLAEKRQQNASTTSRASAATVAKPTL